MIEKYDDNEDPLENCHPVANWPENCFILV